MSSVDALNTFGSLLWLPDGRLEQLGVLLADGVERVRGPPSGCGSAVARGGSSRAGRRRRRGRPTAAGCSFREPGDLFSAPLAGGRSRLVLRGNDNLEEGAGPDLTGHPDWQPLPRARAAGHVKLTPSA